MGESLNMNILLFCRQKKNSRKRQIIDRSCPSENCHCYFFQKEKTHYDTSDISEIVYSDTVDDIDVIPLHHHIQPSSTLLNLLHVFSILHLF